MMDPADGSRCDDRASTASQSTLGRVLVVDDDQAFGRALVRALVGRGYESICVSSGAEALDALERLSFDAALVDVRMPDLDGPALVPLLRAKYPRLEIIMMTAFKAAESAVKSLRAGAFDYLEKPVTATALVKVLARATAHRRNEDTTALHRSSQAIFGAQGLARLPEAIVEVSVQLMSADAVSLLLPAMDGTLHVAHAYGLGADVQRSTRIRVGEGIAGRVASAGRPRIINGNASEDPEFAGAAARSRVKSSIVYPMTSEGRLVGMLTFNRLSDANPFRPDDLDRASVLASQVMLALENQRLSRQTAMSEKLAAVGQLAAGIAHEINTPIQFIGDGLHFLGESIEQILTLVAKYEVLLERANRDALDSELVDDIHSFSEQIDVDDLRLELPSALRRTKDGIARVTNIVQSVKVFGRTDEATKTPTDLARLIETTLTIARSEFKYVADAETDLSDIPPVMGLPGELGQVFLNLTVNAAHAIADKMKALENEQRGRITFKAWVDAGNVLISISDTGCGIAESIRSRIFDPFFTTKEPGRGTGLGLSIVRGIIVDKHGGDIAVESEVGMGTTFLIRLPIDG
jgi:two-component system NtrC family sensor kinase